MTSATVNGTNYTLTYDGNGAVTKYDIAGTSDDKYIEYNAFDQPTRIVIGSSLNDPTPVAVDEFAYGPDGQRYARKSTWLEGGNTVTEHVRYMGTSEFIEDDSNANIQTIAKDRITPNIMRVKIVGTTTDEFYEYAHRDHLGSIDVITDENGNTLDNLAFENFGSRKAKDWTSNISTAELDDLLELNTDHPRRARGFTGHEHLDRTGFIHMNGRVYDPVLGRFLSPDPIVPRPELSQRWNRYSYVMNSPLSLVDPSGFDHDALHDEEDEDTAIVPRSAYYLATGNRDLALVYGWLRQTDGEDLRYRLAWDRALASGAGPGQSNLAGPPSRELLSSSQTDETIDDALLDECRRVGCEFDFSTPGTDNTEIRQFIEVFKAASGLYIVGRLNGLFGRVPSTTLPSSGSVRIGGAATDATTIRSAATVFKTAHYASRLEAVGLSTARVESVVEGAIAATRSNMAVNAAVRGRLAIDGVLVEYRAMLLSNGSVSVGTIFPVLP